MSSPPPKQSISSPTSGNTPPTVLPTPSSSTIVSSNNNNNNKNLIRRELEQQLKEKQKQLQESSSGIGKNVLTRQINQLQQKLKELENEPNSTMDRLKSLERDLTSYRSHPLSSPGISSIRNKEKLLRSPNTSTGLDPLPSPSTSTLLPPSHDSTSLLPLPPPPTGSTPTKRRSKVPNTDRRNTDIEFATEIGQGLLLEVRKMQALLQEKEEMLRTLENQKADLERAAEAMAKQMRQREENEEKLKEETWNLELAKQELVISVTELQTNLNKANAEQNKLAKQVNELRSEIEQLRDKEEKLTATIENMKQRHEQDMTSIRRQAASFQREKQDQAKKIEALTSELAIAKAQSRIGNKHVPDNEATSNTIENLELDPSQTTLKTKKSDQAISVSPPSSPKQSPSRNQAMEVETLKTSLAHAHRMVSNLRSNLHKEKTEKFELKKLLAESQETIEQLQNDPRLWVDAGPSRNSSSTNLMSKAEDGKRAHKVSATGKRRSKKSKLDKKQPRFSSRNNTDNDSVYSYSSMSGEEEESDVEKPRFTSLSSELSQSQKPVLVDAQVNTEPEPRSLGDELGLAMSKGIEITTQTDPEPVKKIHEIFTQTDPEPPQLEMATQTDLVSITEIFVQTDNVVPETADISVQTQVDSNEMSIQTNGPETTEISVQTDGAVTSEICTQTDETVTLEICTQTEDQPVTDISIQTEPPTTVEVSIQTESEASDLLVETEIEIPVIKEIAIQTDDLNTTEIATQTDTSSVLEQFTLGAVSQEPNVCVLQNASQIAMSVEPEDPSIAAAALAAATSAAILASRHAALQAAVDQETQYTVDKIDQGTQHQIVTLDQQVQYDILGKDCGVQSQVDTVDAFIQPEPIETKDTSVQSDTVEAKDTFVQSETTEFKDSFVQSEPIEAKDSFVQSQPFEFKDSFVQSEIESKDSIVQYDPIETKDASVQYEEDFNHITGLATLGNIAASNKIGDRLLLSDEMNQKDTSSFNRNQDKSLLPLVNTVASNNNNKIADETTILHQVADVSDKTKNRSLDENEIVVPVVLNQESIQRDAPTVLNKENAPVVLNQESAPVVVNQANTQKDAPVVLNQESVQKDAPIALNPESIQKDDPTAFNQANTQKDAPTEARVLHENNNVATTTTSSSSNTKNSTPKLYTQDEMDALVAAAVASALANVTDAKENVKREMSTKTNEPKNDADSAVVSHYSGMMTNTDEEDEEQKKHADIEQDEEIIDIPIRPSNPPPIALLSRVGANSSIIDSRSMSPFSDRSDNNKGKTPYDAYFDSEEEKQKLEKMTSMSSMSTNNTHEQLQSISSSQYDPARSSALTTDPTVINLITQTMIGDWMWKYTRRMVGGGMSENRHKRYFWIHPYTRTLYWSTSAPGVDGSEAKAKSALIENIKTVPEYSTNNNGLPNVSLLIQTSQRQLKLTAPNLDKHEAWFEAISHLVSRNENGSSLAMLNDSNKRAENSRSLSSAASGSILKRPSFRRVNDVFQQPSTSTSTHSMATSAGEYDDDEPIEDVRMCCNGKHHVSKLEKDHPHRHRYRKRKSRQTLSTVIA